jgi:hypothetical protein
MRRRRLVLAEFVVAAAIGIGAGALALRGSSPATIVFGCYLVGIGINYAALTLVAWSMLRQGTVTRELEGLDVPAELRRSTIAQVRLLVPLWVAVQALGERRRHRPSE